MNKNIDYLVFRVILYIIKKIFAYCMFLSWITPVALVLGHILNAYSKAWYKRDGISLRPVKIEFVLNLLDDAILIQMNVRPGFVVRLVHLPVDLMAVAHFVVDDATRLGLT